jgi:phospholipase C
MKSKFCSRTCLIFLKYVVLALILPFKVQAQLPNPTNSGIEHVVVVMMENRSFDHLMGWTTNADGRQAGLSFTDTNGNAHSTYPLAPDFQGCAFHDPNHSYVGGRIELNGGACDGWLRAPANDIFCIGYYEQTNLPFLSAAATNWTVCDRYFAAIMAETYPNRIYQHAAQTDRLENTLDVSSLPTIWDRLGDSNVSARYYFSDIPMVALWGFKYLPITRPISSFFDDCTNGTLPSVAYVDPKFFNETLGTSEDDHPHADIRNGQAFLSRVYNAVIASPNWSNTVLVINYDEWGGFFDHVPPTAAPIPPADLAAGNTDGLRGFRVPCVIVSPWAKRGAVAHQEFDHTSVLKMIEWRWNLAPLTVRDQTATNLAEALDFTQTNYTAASIVVPQGPFGEICQGTIVLSQASTNLVITWLNDAQLQVKTNLDTPWVTLTNATSPYVISSPTNQMSFFRALDKWTALVELARQYGFPGF